MMGIAKRSVGSASRTRTRTRTRTLWGTGGGGGDRTRKRSLATTAMAAAVACVLPRFHFGMAVVAAAGASNDRPRFGMQNNNNNNSNSNRNDDGSNANRGRLHPSVVRRWSSSSSNANTNTKSSENDNDSESSSSVSEVLRTLARRLNEPVLLRAATTETATEAAAATTTAAAAATADASQNQGAQQHDRRRTAELADELVRRYSSLPPLTLVRTKSTDDCNSGDDSGFNHDSPCERRSIVDVLANECRPESAAIEAAVGDYLRHKGKYDGSNNNNSNNNNNNNNNKHRRLRKATTPTYEAILDLVMKRNALDGMEFLVALREDLRTIRQQTPREEASSAYASGSASLLDLDRYLRSVLARWFAPGLLVHERITYERSPAAIVEAVAKTEAVHPVRSLDDLKERLSEASANGSCNGNGNPKRVFGLFHPLLPRRPLVVVHAALLSSVPSCMKDVLLHAGERGAIENGGTEQTESETKSETATVAAFYSISNGVKGLAGVGLGEFLLKETIRALTEELPSLRTFVTLSPIPGFRNWIRVQCLLQQQQQQQQQQQHQQQQEGTKRDDLISLEDQAALHECGLVSSTEPFPWEEFIETLDRLDFSELREAEAKAKVTPGSHTTTATATTAAATTTTIRTTASAREDDDNTTTTNNDNDNDTFPCRNPQQHAVVRTVLLKLVSRYLALEKHRGKPLDKVCGFHVGNGAEIHDVRFAADLSRGGLSKSYGLMVNYLYDIEKVPVRQRTFESSLRTVAVGPAVQKWLE